MKLLVCCCVFSSCYCLFAVVAAVVAVVVVVVVLAVALVAVVVLDAVDVVSVAAACRPFAMVSSRKNGPYDFVLWFDCL